MTTRDSTWPSVPMRHAPPIVSISPSAEMVLPKELVAAHDDIQPGARAWFYVDFDYSREGELPFVFHRNPDLEGHPLQFVPSGEAVILGLDMAFERYEHDVQDYVGDYHCHTLSAADVASDDPSVSPDATVFVIDLRQPMPLSMN